MMAGLCLQAFVLMGVVCSAQAQTSDTLQTEKPVGSVEHFSFPQIGFEEYRRQYEGKDGPVYTNPSTGQPYTEAEIRTRWEEMLDRSPVLREIVEFDPKKLFPVTYGMPEDELADMDVLLRVLVSMTHTTKEEGMLVGGDTESLLGEWKEVAPERKQQAWEHVIHMSEGEANLMLMLLDARLYKLEKYLSDSDVVQTRLKDVSTLSDKERQAFAAQIKHFLVARKKAESARQEKKGENHSSRRGGVGGMYAAMAPALIALQSRTFNDDIRPIPPKEPIKLPTNEITVPTTLSAPVPENNEDEGCFLYKKKEKLDFSSLNIKTHIQSVRHNVELIKRLRRSFSKEDGGVSVTEMTNALQQTQMLMKGGSEAKKASAMLNDSGTQGALGALDSLSKDAQIVANAQPDVLDKIANGIEGFDEAARNFSNGKQNLGADDAALQRGMEDFDKLQPALEQAAENGVPEAKDLLDDYAELKTSFCMVKDAQELSTQTNQINTVRGAVVDNQSALQALNNQLYKNNAVQESMGFADKTTNFLGRLQTGTAIIGNVASGFANINNLESATNATGNLARVTTTYAKMSKVADTAGQIIMLSNSMAQYSKLFTEATATINKIGKCIPKSKDGAKLNKWKKLFKGIFKFDTGGGDGEEEKQNGLKAFMKKIVNGLKKIDEFAKKMNRILQVVKQVVNTVKTMVSLIQMQKMMDGFEDGVQGLNDAQEAQVAMDELKESGAESAIDQVDSVKSAVNEMKNIKDLDKVDDVVGSLGEAYDVGQSLNRLYKSGQGLGNINNLQQGTQLVNNIGGALNQVPVVGNCMKNADVQGALAAFNNSSAFISNLQNVKRAMQQNPSLYTATNSLQAINSGLQTLPYVSNYMKKDEVQKAVENAGKVGTFLADTQSLKDNLLNPQSMEDVVGALQRMNANFQNIPAIQSHLNNLDKVTKGLNNLRMGANLMGQVQSLSKMNGMLDKVRGMSGVMRGFQPMQGPINKVKETMAGVMEKINKLNGQICLRMFGSREKKKGWKLFNKDPEQKDFGVRWCLSNFVMPVGPATVYGAVGKVFADNRYENISLKGGATYAKNYGVGAAARGFVGAQLSANAPIYTNLMSNLGINLPGINSLADGVSGALPAFSMSKRSSIPAPTLFWNYGWMHRNLDYSSLSTRELYRITHSRYKYRPTDGLTSRSDRRIQAYSRDMLAGGYDAELTGRNQIKKAKGYYGTFSCKPIRSYVCPLGKCSDTVRNMLELDACANQYIVPLSLSPQYTADLSYGQAADAAYMQPLSMVPPNDCKKNALGECITINRTASGVKKETLHEYDVNYYLKRAWYGTLVLPYFPNIIDSTPNLLKKDDDRLRDILNRNSKQTCYSFVRMLKSMGKLANSETDEEAKGRASLTGNTQLVGSELCGFYDSDGSYISVDAFGRNFTVKKISDANSEEVVYSFGKNSNYGYVDQEDGPYKFDIQMKDIASGTVERIFDVTHPFSPRWDTLKNSAGESLTERERYSKCTEFRFNRHKGDCGDGMNFNLMGIKIGTNFIPLLYKGYGDHTGVPFDKNGKVLDGIIDDTEVVGKILSTIAGKGSVSCAATPVDIMTFREAPFHRCILCRIKRNEDCFWKEFNEIIMMQVITKFAEETAFTVAKEACAYFVGDTAGQVCGMLVKAQFRLINHILTGHEDLIENDITTNSEGERNDGGKGGGVKDIMTLIFNAFFATLHNQNPYLESGLVKEIFKQGMDKNISDFIRENKQTAMQQAEQNVEYKAEKDKAIKDMSIQKCGKLLQWFCKPIINMMAKIGKKGGGAMDNLGDQMEAMNTKKGLPMFCKNVLANRHQWPPCSTRYNKADPPGGICAQACPTGIKQCCHDLSKSLTPINALKMTPYKKRDNKYVESDIRERYEHVMNQTVFQKKEDETYRYTADGLSFMEYFGDRRPYMRMWDTGSEEGALGNMLGQIDYSSNSGAYVRIVGVGDDKRSCRAGGWRGMQDYLDKSGQKTPFFVPDTDLTRAPGVLTNKVLNQPGTEMHQAHALTGWSSLKLYQARCYKYFRLNGLCMFEKVFKQYTAEDAALQMAGVKLQVSGTNNKPFALEWPLAFRGYVGSDGPNAKETMPEERFPNFGITGRNRGLMQGMYSAIPGDILIWDFESFAQKKRLKQEESKYPYTAYNTITPHVAYVTSANTPSMSPSGKGRGTAPFYIDVTTYNQGRNPDTCGLTDQVAAPSTRRIYMEYDKMPDTIKQTFEKLAKATNMPATSVASCYNPDLSVCFDDMWHYVKVYRPVLDHRGGTCMVRKSRRSTEKVDLSTLTDSQIADVPEEDVRICMNDGMDPPLQLIYRQHSEQAAALPETQLTNLCSPGYGGLAAKSPRRKRAGIFNEQGCPAVELTPRPVWKGTPKGDILQNLGVTQAVKNVQLKASGVLGFMPCGGGVGLQEAVVSNGRRYANEKVMTLAHNIQVGRPTGSTSASPRDSGYLSDVASSVCPGFSITGLKNQFNAILPKNMDKNKRLENDKLTVANGNDPKEQVTVITPDESVIYVDTAKGPATFTLPNGGEFPASDYETIHLTGSTTVQVTNGQLKVLDGAQRGLTYATPQGTLDITPYGAVTAPQGAKLSVDLNQPLIVATNTLADEPHTTDDTGVLENEFMLPTESQDIMAEGNTTEQKAQNLILNIEKEMNNEGDCEAADPATQMVYHEVNRIVQKQRDGKELTDEEVEYLDKAENRPHELGFKGLGAYCF